MIAFHGEETRKAEYLDRVRRHREADEIVQSYGYWSDGKGCAVGCTLHDDDSPHPHYEAKLGIPERLAWLEDAIFEGLPVADSKAWPERFLSAVPVGADLSLVWHRFVVWLLRDSELLTITDVNREAISAVIALHVRASLAEAVAAEEWSAARSAAESAAASAAAESAARSESESAAWSARSAARSAADSAAESAESAAYQKMADKLIDLLQSA